ncbi:hypothetical protein GCM10020367_46000 [Streptomyces sannanensis]|uniref:Uncharacterized protein n=1 Tax=Streptomyces sannanensis TaxID=285536 RepID=A0ABP6SGP4_9ACTN
MTSAVRAGRDGRLWAAGTGVTGLDAGRRVEQAKLPDIVKPDATNRVP